MGVSPQKETSSNVVPRKTTSPRDEVTESLFPGFEVEEVQTTGARIHTLRKGGGPPLLLLHGYPQTHVVWHKAADRLAEKFSVVLTDLRGYGDSSKPEGGERRENYSFRAMAKIRSRSWGILDTTNSLSERMTVGQESPIDFASIHPTFVRKVCFMDIIPTLTMYQQLRWVRR